MHLGGVITSFTEDIKDFPTGILALTLPVGDAHHDLIVARRALGLIRRDKDIFSKLPIERYEEGVASRYLQASDIGRLTALQDLDDLHSLVFPAASTHEGDGYTVAVQCIRQRTIGERKSIDLGVIGDEGGTACAVIKATFETLWS